jgi:hypothetical protein
MYEYMLKHLRACRDNVGLLKPLRDAAEAGLAKFEIYYAKARGCQLNVIATRMSSSLNRIRNVHFYFLYSVLHPSFGRSWFNKMGSDREESAKVLFEHAYISYQQIHNAENPASSQKSRLSRPGTHSAFLDDVCMVDVEEQDLPVVGELERFYDARKTYGSGVLNSPLAWWKVSAISEG